MCRERTKAVESGDGWAQRPRPRLPPAGTADAPTRLHVACLVLKLDHSCMQLNV